MTSTNFNVGMADPRNSSRVLKPPGGGHSDIFGVYHQEQATPRGKYHQPRSTIGEVFGGSIPIPMNNPTNGNEKTEEEPQNTQVANENDAPKPSMPVPQRTRVPPGGFSSGLW